MVMLCSNSVEISIVLKLLIYKLSTQFMYGYTVNEWRSGRFKSLFLWPEFWLSTCVACHYFLHELEALASELICSRSKIYFTSKTLLCVSS